MTIMKTINGKQLVLFPEPKTNNIADDCYGWVPPEHIRIDGIRFAMEVPNEECNKCPYSSWGHPLIPNIESEKITGVLSWEKLCIKDCMKSGIKMEKNDMAKTFSLNNRLYKYNSHD